MAKLPAHRKEHGGARWEPFAELQAMRERLDTLLADSSAAALSGELWSPPVDVEETDDAWVVEADLPGVKKSDISVELLDGELHIHGEVKERERVGILRRRTRRTGQFDYRVQLPGDLSAENIDANLADGVLTIRLPKPQRARPHRIEIKGS